MSGRKKLVITRCSLRHCNLDHEIGSVSYAMSGPMPASSFSVVSKIKAIKIIIDKLSLFFGTTGSVFTLLNLITNVKSG